ncbi:MAG: hypothetical protein NUW01_20365, partial [Gemmatimonadaceae bacterium]|nr:hypothetical protein [Gemmatimonadaceae bacterium]
PIDELFVAISVNEQIPLDAAPAEVSPSVAQAFRVDRLPGGNLRYTSRNRRMVPTNVRASLQDEEPGLNEFEFQLGPFKCEAKVEGGLSFPVILDAFSFEVNSSLTYDVVITGLNAYRAVAHGDITTTMSSDVLINAAVTGSAECKYKVKEVQVRAPGWLGLFVGGQIPLEVGFALDAKAELAGIGYDAFFQSTMTAAFGFDCTGGCHAVGDLTSKNAGGFFKPRLPASFNELRTELAASLFGLATLKIGNPFEEDLQFKVLALRVGLEQKAELASEKG